MGKLSFLEITNRIVEEDNLSEDNTSIPSFNSDYNRKFKNYVSQLGIDPNIFKDGAYYSFEEESIPFIKKLVQMDAKSFKKILRSNPNRDLTTLNTFMDELHRFLEKELSTQPDDLIKAKSFSELVLARNSENLLDATKYFFEPLGAEGLPHSDIAELSSYYFKELSKTKEKYEAIRSIFADIRDAEIENMSQKKIKESYSDDDQAKVVHECIYKIMDIILNDNSKEIEIMKNYFSEDEVSTLRKKSLSRSELRKIVLEKVSSSEAEILGIGLSEDQNSCAEVSMYSESNIRSHEKTFPAFPLTDLQVVDSSEYMSPQEVLEEALLEYEKRNTREYTNYDSTEEMEAILKWLETDIKERKYKTKRPAK